MLWDIVFSEILLVLTKIRVFFSEHSWNFKEIAKRNSSFFAKHWAVLHVNPIFCSKIIGRHRTHILLLRRHRFRMLFETLCNMLGWLEWKSPLHRAVKDLRGNKLLNLFTNAQWFCTEGKAKQLIVVWYVPLSNTFVHGFGSRLRGAIHQDFLLSPKSFPAGNL